MPLGQVFHRIGSIVSKSIDGRAGLYRMFERRGLAVADRIRIARLNHACALMRDPTLDIGEVALRCGDADLSAFGKAFGRRFGMTPRDWRTTLAWRGRGWSSPEMPELRCLEPAWRSTSVPEGLSSAQVSAKVLKMVSCFALNQASPPVPSKSIPAKRSLSLNTKPIPLQSWSRNAPPAWSNVPYVADSE